MKRNTFASSDAVLETLLKNYFADPKEGKVFRRKTGEEVGSLQPGGYVTIGVFVDGRVTTMPRGRVIFALVHGRFPSEIDHANRVRSDDRIDNLRECSRLENARNRKRRGTPQLPRGVQKNGKKFAAVLWTDGKRTYLGQADTAEEASKVWESAARPLHGEFYLNP